MLDIEDVFHAVEAVRAEQAQQHASRLGVLTEIRDDVRALVQALQEPLPEPTSAPCTHPPAFRTDSTPGARFWKCRVEDCGFVYDSETSKAPA